MMQHLILLFALLALPVSAVMAEEQGATEDERDQFTYEESATEDEAQRDSFTFEETSTEEDAATRQDAAFPEEEDQTDASAESDWEREGTMRTETATVGAEEDEQPQEQRVGMEQEDQQFGQEMGQEQQGQGEASVARAQFASDVQDREPVDDLTEANTDEAPIFFFTEVEGAEGETVTHRWSRDGEVMAEVDLEVGSDNWRTWSSKEMMPDWDGEWTVEVVDSQGNVLAEDSINVQGGQAQFQQAGFQDDQAQEDQAQQEMGAEQQEIGFEDDQDWDSQQQEATFEDDQDMEAERQEISVESDEEGMEVEQREIGFEDEQDSQQDAQDDDSDNDWDW